mmetsp:Transcript_294/g.594  ORF Transcript_294/g.594 Transcript_294/m.594 type:complete len:112 (+) Transcript_294:133-468(+)
MPAAVQSVSKLIVERAASTNQAYAGHAEHSVQGTQIAMQAILAGDCSNHMSHDTLSNETSITRFFLTPFPHGERRARKEGFCDLQEKGSCDDCFVAVTHLSGCVKSLQPVA